MTEEKKKAASLDAKWDACLDIVIKRVAYSSLAGAFSGLLFFRSPTSRWASVALGAGIGIGTAYTECSYIFDDSYPKLSAPKVSAPTVSAVPSASSQDGRVKKDAKVMPYRN